MIIASVPERYDSAWINALVAEIEGELSDALKRDQRLYIGTNVNTEIVMISPNGTRYKLGVADDGSIATEAV